MLLEGLLAVSMAGVAWAEPPFRLQQALEPPAWLELSGNSRIRYEHLNGQYRAGLSGNDQVLALRTLLRADAGRGPLTAHVELTDSRTYLDDDGTLLSSSYVNVTDLLQGHLRWRWDGPGGWHHALHAGRATLDIGSRRFVERNGYRNTINSYDGLYWIARRRDGRRLDAFYAAPVLLQPRDRDALGGNDWNPDDANPTRRYWGVHWQQPETINFADRKLRGELFAYGLEETDRDGELTANRAVWELGFRLYGEPRPGLWDLDLEGSWRRGQQRAAASAGARWLDVHAHMLHAELGYSWDSRWHWRWALELNLASGDDDPNDDRYERYERFYGTRRRDLGHTSLFGPLTWSNVRAWGMRLDFKRGRWDGRGELQWAELHSGQDAWLQARRVDASGASGSELGWFYDGRLRYWLRPDSLRLELGGSAFWFGEFPRKVPDGPEGSRTLYAYSQLTLTF